MKKPTYIIILLILVKVSLASDTLNIHKNSNAIINNFNVEIEVFDQTRAVLKINSEITILNNNGKKHAVFYEYYDKFRKVKSFEGLIIDNIGNTIQKVKFRDLIDRSLINNFSLYEDNRIKYYEPQVKKFPYKVKYSYEIELNGIFQFPSWQPLYSSHLSVTNATLKIIQPLNNPVRYNLIQIGEPEIKQVGDKLIYDWQVSNLISRKKEPFNLRYSLTSPTVHIAPNKFSIDGFSGSMNTWQEFGKWRYNLIVNQSNLPGEAIDEVKKLVSDLSDKFEISKAIYEYMQSRTRYVSIQEGIGGWQPIDANTVHNLGYGDCKALTNYMKSLLNAVGINSIYAVVRAGINEPDLIKNFPSNQFNHAILCIPLEKDTIWLECTSQSAPFGYLGDFTGNKNALLITDEGGKIAKTTEYTKEDNVQYRKAFVRLKEDGHADAVIQTMYKGLQYENISYYIDKSKKDQTEFLLKNLELNNFELKEFKLREERNLKPLAYDSILVDINNLGNSTSSRIFFELNLMNKNDFIPVNVEKRISPIRFTYPYLDIDSIEFSFPENYIIEYLPDNFSENNQFGEYSISFKATENKVVVLRKLSFNKDFYPPESYVKLVEFYENIALHDKSKCVLKKNN